MAPSKAQCVVVQVEFESKLESGLSYVGFKRLVPGGFNLGFIGSTCTALPVGDEAVQGLPRGVVRGYAQAAHAAQLVVPPQLEIESEPLKQCITC
jgi:hypothetical protein